MNRVSRVFLKTHGRMLSRCIVGFIVSAAILGACGYGQPGTKGDSARPWTVWFTNPREYATNSLDVAQRETPFTIVLPTHVPADLAPLPIIQGRAKSDFDNTVPVRISYRRGDTELVIIEESNMTFPISSPSDNRSRYLDYSGTQVLEFETTWLWPRDGAIVDVPAFIYSWNKGGVHFLVDIIEYDRDEARKIVESLIK